MAKELSAGEKPAPIQVEVVQAKELTPVERMAAYLHAETDTQPASQKVFDGDEELNQVKEAILNSSTGDEDASTQGQEEDAGTEEEDASTEEVLEETEELHVETLADLAEQLEVDVADLYNITVPLSNIDGVETNVPLGEWKAHVQNHFREELKQVAEQKQASEQEIAATNAYLEQQVQTSQAFIGQLEKELTGSINAVDWQALRKDKPGEYAAKIQEQEARVNQLNSFKAHVDQLGIVTVSCPLSVILLLEISESFC